jgi:predicted alpha/beta hydrolase family esterase
MKLGQKIAINYIRAKLNLLAVLSNQLAAKKAFTLFCTPFKKKGNPLPVIFDSAEKLQVQVQGIAVRGFRWNKGGIKRVLILHGFESSSKNFEAYINPLINKNYEVLAFDAPAHGVSSGTQISLPLYVDTIRTIYFEVGTIQSFMAHSFGGLAVAHFVEKIPHDINTRLALIAPATETTTAIDTFFRFLQLGKEVRKEFEKIIIQKAGVGPEHFSIPRAIQHINASILWVHDKDDDVTPIKDIEPVICQHYPNLQFLITSGLGHRKVYRDSHVINAVTEFL